MAKQSNDERLAQLLDDAASNQHLAKAYEQYRQAAVLTPAPQPPPVRTRYSSTANS